MNTNHVENKPFLNKVRNFIFGSQKVNGTSGTSRVNIKSANVSGNGNKSFMNKTRNYIFGSKNATAAANVSSNTGNTGNTQNIGTSRFKIIIFILLFLIIGFIVSYLTVMTIKYWTTDCLNKKSYGDYIFGFNYNAVCHIPFHPVIIPESCGSEVSGYGEGGMEYGLEEEMNDGNRLLSASAIMGENDGFRENVKSMSNIPHSNPTNPVVDVDINDLEGPEQVFHISNQDYTYEDARCKCESYSAKLATYPQIVESYNKGADWCSYGWSEGQTAYYPTQKCNWKKKSRKEQEACGKPGINGGFFSDKKLRFGVNCFGKKPEGKIIKIKDDKCGSEDGDNGKCNYNSSHRLETDEIAPFNDNTWSA